MDIFITYIIYIRKQSDSGRVKAYIEIVSLLILYPTPSVVMLNRLTYTLYNFRISKNWQWSMKFISEIFHKNG